MGPRIEREVDNYEDGSMSVTDVFMKDDGTLYTNTYNVTSDRSMHDHTVVDEYGNYLGGHEEDERPWVDKDYAFRYLSSLPFGKLQMIEALHPNAYVRHSAKYLMSQTSQDLDLGYSMRMRKAKF